MPRLQQPLVAMTTIKLTFVEQSFPNFCFALRKSHGTKCVNFVQFGAKLCEWQTHCHYLSIAPRTATSFAYTLHCQYTF